jgi:histidine triad (HIT) family protein
MPDVSDRFGRQPPGAPCPFCAIVTGTADAEVIRRWPDAIAFRPHDPVTDGHLLVIPNGHVPNALDDPAITAAVMQRAAELGGLYGCDLNLITSVGQAATQSIRHLHVHIVPRFDGDGLQLPWTAQQAGQVRRD